MTSMFKLHQIAYIFVRPLCRTNSFWSGPTFGSSWSWSPNIKCRMTRVTHTVHTSTTHFMSHNHVVPSCTTEFLSVWTHLYAWFKSRGMEVTFRVLKSVSAMHCLRLLCLKHLKLLLQKYPRGEVVPQRKACFTLQLSYIFGLRHNFVIYLFKWTHSLCSYICIARSRNVSYVFESYDQLSSCDKFLKHSQRYPDLFISFGSVLCE